MKVSIHKEHVYYLFIIWYICGGFLLGFDLLPAWMNWSNGVFLLLAGLVGGIYFFVAFGRPGVLYGLFVFLATMGCEALGVHYGILFGSYIYHGAFGPEVLGVPVGIGFAWVMVMATSHAFTTRILARMTSNRLLFPLLAALTGMVIAVTMDLILDPVAAAREYWTWEKSGPYFGIPTQNFIGWAVLSFVLHLLKNLFMIPVKPANVWWEERMIWLYALIVALFSMLAVQEGVEGAAYITIMITALWVVLYIRGRKGEML
ncbi:carotenoid biosynthesis protein [Aureibacillus halotolerans]|uniref:Putative membrane protein n=1 Tax=Aureibacillus halotolerans TaxID=1508390 RepID=A0A4R6U6F1_9BACI|nr:carotenoid biosynthesis protein [Aureibacillus halotolerans]TDQ42090.1 putative membrane protein [Aureibacillus halotolerans]